MSNVKTDLPGYYAARAGEYEKIYDKPERQDDLEELHEQVAETLLGHKVLEIACGTGYWTAEYADFAESVLATDIGAEVLELARQKGMPDTVEFAQMDAYDLDVEGRGITACFAAFWWSHVPREKQNAYLEMLRKKLGKDALLVLIDNSYVDGSSTVIAKTDAEGNTYQLRHLENGETYEVMKNFPTDSALRKKFAPYAREIRMLRQEYYWMLTCRLK